MSTATRHRKRSDVTVLQRVPYKVYARLSGAWENRHLRMTYNDGTLEIVSPILQEHEWASTRLRILVATISEALGLAYHGTDTTTFRRGGEGPFEGKGKQPDQSFYFASIARVPRDRSLDLDNGDPPPDFWIEVDNRGSSLKRLPIYAALRVPEVWRYRARKKTLSFLRLVGDGYEPIDRSLSLPVLTPSLVLEALALGEGALEYEFAPRLRAWVGERFGPGNAVQ